jgi:hypothetical protein
MKRYVLIVVIAACAVMAQAQTKDNATVPRVLPALNPDLMTYFQEEMTSHMRYQMSKEDNIPFFISFRYRSTGLTESRVDDEDYRTDDEYTKNADNAFVNALVEWQAKINDTVYIPIFAAMAYGNIDGVPDAGSLIIDNLSSFDDGLVNDSITKYLFGGGLFINGKTIKGGIYAGYCLEHYEINHVGKIDKGATWKDEVYYQKDDTWKHSLKIALLPALDTSNWKYVGNVLNTVLGYIGLGDMVDVYAREEEDKTAAAIIDALNYGLDFGFKELEFKTLPLNARLFYRRDNYDAIARADTYGAAMGVSFPILSSSPILSSRIGIESEFGFRHFNSVSKYFRSQYPDTGFFSVSIVISDFKNFIMRGAFERISLTYRYDDIAKHLFVFSVVYPRVCTFIAEIGGGENSYDKGNYDIKKTAFTFGFGVRFSTY